MSYRKPASLILTLLTLHRHSAGRIGTVWITDDMSGDTTLARLRDPELARRLLPWRLDIALSRRRGGWTLTHVTGRHLLRLARPGTAWGHRARSLHSLLRRGLSRPADIRYQRAFDATGADYMLTLHDDVEVTGDVVGHLAAAMEADPRLAIAGQLGQCWRCGEAAGGCSPARILAGKLPSARWPVTAPPAGLRWRGRDRACRINEWCALIRVAAARQLARAGVHFGNMEDGGDIGAYWFAQALAEGWHFADPFHGRDTGAFFVHGWQGHPGHDVWRDRGTGRAAHDEDAARARLWREFGYRMA